jgi:helicase MOV-10
MYVFVIGCSSSTGDRILIQKQGSQNGHWHEGGVHVVRKEEVGMKFHSSFRPSTRERFQARFKLNRYPMRRQHQALDTAFTQDRVLFPLGEHLPNAIKVPGAVFSTEKVRVFNPLIAQNPPQLQAVASIMRMPAGSVPFVVFGP